MKCFIRSIHVIFGNVLRMKIDLPELPKFGKQGSVPESVSSRIFFSWSFFFQTLTSVFLLWLIISTCIKKMYYSTFPFQFVQCNFFFAELQLRFFTLFNYLRLLCITIVYYNYSLNFGLLSTSARDQKSYLGLSFLHEFFSQNY